jgi:hypothetical protein
MKLNRVHVEFIPLVKYFYPGAGQGQIYGAISLGYSPTKYSNPTSLEDVLQLSASVMLLSNNKHTLHFTPVTKSGATGAIDTVAWSGGAVVGSIQYYAGSGLWATSTACFMLRCVFDCTFRCPI